MGLFDQKILRNSRNTLENLAFVLLAESTINSILHSTTSAIKPSQGCVVTPLQWRINLEKKIDNAVQKPCKL